MSRYSEPPPAAERSFERILLVKPSSLGDIIHTLPVLHGLRRRFPDAQIDWLVAAAFVPMVAGHPDLNSVISFDRRRFGSMARSPRRARDFLRFLRNLRAQRYDLVIDLQGLFRSALFTRATGAPVRIGFRRSRELARCFYTCYIPGDDDPERHAVLRNYLVAALLGFADVPITFDLALPETAHIDAMRLLRSAGVEPHTPFVAIAPGARWETKRWPVERFSRIVDHFHGRNGLHCLLVGSPEEKALAQQIAANCWSEPGDLTGRTSLQQLAAVLSRAAAVLCHDSAAAHLAAALGRPLVCITGPTNPARTGPFDRPDDAVRLSLACMPCYLRKLSQCPHRHGCMEELSVDRIIAELERRLQGDIPLPTAPVS